MEKAEWQRRIGSPSRAGVKTVFRMDGIVTEVNGRHLVATQTAIGFSVFEQMGPHFRVGDDVSWTEGMSDGYVVNRTSKKQYRVFFQCRNTTPDGLVVHMRGQV